MWPDETEKSNNFDGDCSSLLEMWERTEPLDMSLFSPFGSSPFLQGSPFLSPFELYPNTGPRVNSVKSIPSWSGDRVSTSEIQNYDGSSHYSSGYKTPAMHCGQKRQETADNLESQKYRRVDNSSFPRHRRNSPPISNQSNHTESDQWSGKHPTTEEINMPEGRAFESHELKRYTMLCVESLIPDALANTFQPLQNGMPCEDRCETSTKRNNQEKETHFEEQPTEIQRNNPVWQAIVETIEGHNIPNAVTDHDVVDHSTHMGAQFFLESTSTQPLSSFYSIENIKLLFDNLIALPLEVLSDPDKETFMKKVLVILKDNASSFSKKLEGQILDLCVEIPALLASWRELYSQFQMYRQQAETEKIRDLAGRDEESLRVRYEVVENKEKELIRQLDEVQRQKAEIAEQRTENSKLTKDLKEKEAHRNKEHLMTIATAKLNKLYVQWAKIQSFFT